jgi:hypothetical protein
MMIETESSTATSRSLPRVFFVLVAILGLAVLITALVYRLPINNPFTRAIVSVLPYPAVVVNGSMISMEAYINEQDALVQYLNTTGFEQKPSQEVIRQTILDALVNKAAIRALALERRVKIDQARVEQYYQDVVASQESEEAFAKELSKSFGWNTGEFKERIIKSIVLALQMSEYALANPELQQESRAQIEAMRTQLEQGDQSVLKEDLGYQTVSSLPAVWVSVSTLPIGGRTDILESDEGFAILQVTDRIETTQEIKLRLAAAMVPKKTIENWVDEYLASAKIRYFVK